MSAVHETRIIAAPDGAPLLLRRCAGLEGSSGPVILLGHGPSVHSGLLGGPIGAFVEAGATVWAGDLRGHGGSVSARAPLAHLDPATGWESLLGDMQAFARVAFRDVPFERRLLVGGGLSGHLMLELLAREPDLAGHLVMAAPTPYQPGVHKVGVAFLRLRSLTRPLATPDPQLQHHVYGFLRAQLPAGTTELAVISADPEVQRAIEDDPRGYPTPTPGYWLSIFPQIATTWNRIARGSLSPDLRVLLLAGPEDPQTRGGSLLPKLQAWFHDQSLRDAQTRLIEGVRANVLIDAPRLPVVPVILDWFHGGARPQTTAPTRGPDAVQESDAYLPALEMLGLGDGMASASIPTLIDLCYAALDDDRRWIELIYRLALGAEADWQDAERLLEVVFPHWQRSFELREDLRRAAMLGHLYADLIDRLDLGVAVLDADRRLRHANPAFGRALSHIAPDHAARPEAWLQRLIPATEATGLQDLPLIWERQVVGLCFVPKSLRPEALGAAPGGRLVVLRSTGDNAVNREHRAGLLALAYGLTGKEGTAALLLAEGLSTEAIAETMVISENTLRSHLKQVFQKMEVTSRTDLAHRLLSGPLGWLAMPQEAPRRADPARGILRPPD